VETIAYLTAKKGATSFYVAASGSVIPNCNQSMESIPYSREEWDPSFVPNLQKWIPTAEIVEKIKLRMFTVNALGSSAERFE
jgi:hypothetical protein